VGALFIAGFGAGVVYALSFSIYTFFFAKNIKKDIVVLEKSSIKEVLKALVDCAWGIGLSLIILGGIYSGIFTPTEAAAVAAVYALVVTVFIYRELDLKGVYKVLKNSAIITAQIMILLASASVFAWILTSEGITVTIAKKIIGISSNKYVILALMNIVVLIAGMFIDGASIIMILGPLFYPIAMQVNIDPIHLGIVIVVNCAIGMFTPPFGLNLFVASSITKLSIFKISRGVIPFIIMSIIALLLITYIPGISLWLPRQIYGAW
jgi:C4-dicarboxylate transporter DctM subunit